MHKHSRTCPRTIGTGFTDDKDDSRTIRTGFTDRFVVSHGTREITERCFLMDESLYKGHFAWLLELYSIHCICLRIYFAGIFNLNY